MSDDWFHTLQGINPSEYRRRRNQTMTQPKTASKFTPEKWLNELHARNDYPQRGDGGCYDSVLDGWVCEVRTLTGGVMALAIGNDRAPVEGRARLIAAAPGMYELLSWIENMGQSGMSFRWIEDEARRIKAAIDGEG